MKSVSQARHSVSRPVWRIALRLAILAPLLSCGSGGGKGEKVVIYTSMYESVITELKPVIGERFPGIEVEWFQSGSEKIAAKVNQQIAAGDMGADILMTSDPFWYAELKNAGHLMKYESPGAARVPAALRDPDSAFVTVRMPLMVMTVNGSIVPEGERPKTFKELAEPKWKGRLTMGDPNSSGSNFTAAAALGRKYGREYFEALRSNEILASGGNSSVLSRVTTGEKPVGIILLENLLKDKADNPGTPLVIIYPEDGSIPVPSPIAITAKAGSPDSARALYDFLLSDEGQRAIVHGWMYSPVEGMEAPAGARPWSEVGAAPLVPWTPEYLAETLARREEIKKEFNSIVFE